MTVTIRDASTGRIVSGSLVKQYPLGLTIDDARGIRHYATFDRVISGYQPHASGNGKREQGWLFQ